MKDFRKPSQRLKKMGHEAHFELADSDDFFGFQVTNEDASLLKVTAFCLAGIVLLATMWWGLGQVQRTCLERNEGNITLCE